MIDSDGSVNSGVYKDFVRIKKLYGTADQVADPDLIAETAELPVGQRWTTDHRLRGVAGLYVRFKYSQNKFPSGVPNVSAYVLGRKILDTRDDVTRFTYNVPLMVRDYISNSRFGLDEADEFINDDFTDASANTAEEIVDTENYDTDVFYEVNPISASIALTSTGSSTFTFTIDEAMGSELKIQTLDRDWETIE